jgi:hypothetical protein
MTRRDLLVLALGASLSACGANDALPPPSATRCITTCDASAPIGGGGVPVRPGDAAVALDSAADASATTVSGALRVFRDLPPGNVFSPSVAGWTVRTLPLFDADAGTPVELTAMTDSTGAFTLPGLPMRQTLPGETAAGYWLLATAPAAGRISSLFTVRDSAALQLDTVTDETVRTALAAASLVQADDRAMVAVLVRQSSVRDALPVQGVRVQAEGQSSATLYDSVAGLEIAETGTGRVGFALLPNVPVPATGDGYAVVIADRAARPYQVRVRRSTLSWLLVVSS